jgi:DNA polymerase-3 subunit gamma/tau
MLKPAPQAVAMPNPQTFDEVLQLIEKKRDISLRVDVERYVRLVSFMPGAITFEPAPNAPIDLVRKLSLKLKEWTGQRWLIATQGGGGAETIYERDQREVAAMRSRITEHPFVKGLLETFPGAEITSIRPKIKPQDTGVTTAPPEDDDTETEQGQE